MKSKSGASVSPMGRGSKNAANSKNGELSSPPYASPRPSGSKWQSSYMDKPSGTPRGSIVNLEDSFSRMSIVSPMNSIPDMKIKVTIPDIDRKMRARKARTAAPVTTDEESVPEHIRRFREREERARLAMEEKEFRIKQRVESYFYAWKARAQYPRLKRTHEKRLQKFARERALKKLRLQSAIKIQSTFRMYVPRKRYVFVRDCKRRREKNQKEINRIEKKLARMPKDTKTELKEMKKYYSDKKKELKKIIRGAAQEEDGKVDKIKEQAQNMISYLRQENKKIKEHRKAIQREQEMLEKQFDLLVAKSDKISPNFASLQQYVLQKNQAIAKNEAAAQKCRHRYLPKYRKDLKDRNKHCIGEFRVKLLYKRKVEMILREIETRSSDREIVKNTWRAHRACQKEIGAKPEVPIPPELSEYLDEDY